MDIQGLRPQTGTHFFGADYSHSLPTNKSTTKKLDQLANERDQFDERNADKKTEDIEVARSVYKQRENIISLLKETNFGKQGGECAFVNARSFRNFQIRPLAAPGS